MMKIGKIDFDLENKCYIMGILNLTPDSFSDGNKFNSIDNALYQVENMINKGASIIDIGGESTRPGHIKISDDEEIERIYKIIIKIKNNFDIPISLDSYKSNVVKFLGNNIDMVNDIWGLKWDDEMANIVSKLHLPICLMHNRKKHNYTNFRKDIILDLKESVNIALKSGIDKNKIIIDAGCGFQKTYEENLVSLQMTNELKKMGFPILVAASKKSVIGITLDLPINERNFGTPAISAYAFLNGASIIRVHDVYENMQVIKMINAIKEVNIG